MSSQYAGRKRRRSSLTSDAHEDSAARTAKDSSSSRAGAQHNNSGAGRQYNNSNSGTQYNADKIKIVNNDKSSLLADLRVTDPRDDKRRIERTKGNLLKDSYIWILDHDDFNQWRAEKQLLWIKGGPGKGKTMLLCGVINELRAMGYKSTFFFFCQATDARLNNATSVLRGLLYLMIDENPNLFDLLHRKYGKTRAGKQLFEDVNSWEVLCEMLLLVLRHESLQDAILIIDALDECISGLDQLIGFIIDLTTHVKIIVSSRLWLSIDRGLAAALEDTKVYLSLELNEDVVSAAVDKYIHHKVHQLARHKGYDDELKTTVQMHLTTHANNTFLWVALVYEQLANNNVAKRHTQQKLHEFPPGLDSLYERALNHIFGLLDAEHCKQALAIMSIVSRPLNLTELSVLLDEGQFVAEIVEECGSLLIVREGIVYFIHQSIKDFLLRNANKLMPAGIDHIHSLVLSKLLQVMSNTLKRNIYDIDTPGTPIEEICVPVPDPLSSLRYACVYWADHLVDGTVGQHQHELVRAFITQHFLHWLESLSIMRSISEAATSLSRVQRIIEVCTFQQ
ncbi:hypothetical protein N0V92_011773 [Colletotrichum tropicale]|nr:hypothetical protein N0V92_011773 [Colletotrichum tropicale]